MREKVSISCIKLTAGFPKPQSACPKKQFVGKKFEKNDGLLIILYFGAKNWTSGEKFQ